MKFKIFENYPHLIYGMSNKSHGEMGNFHDQNPKENWIENRKNFISSLDIEPDTLVAALLVHGNKVANITDLSRSRIEDTDALITKEKGITIGLTSADCLPIFFFDPREEEIAIAHSGWRGTLKNIAAETIRKMTNSPENILAAIGPSIHSCHFEVGEDVFSKFNDYPNRQFKKENTLYIDLPGTVKDQLQKVGLKEKNIEIHPDCTFCDKEKYFSYRRDKPETIETMLAVMTML